MRRRTSTVAALAALVVFGVGCNRRSGAPHAPPPVPNDPLLRAPACPPGDGCAMDAPCAAPAGNIPGLEEISQCRVDMPSRTLGYRYRGRSARSAAELRPIVFDANGWRTATRAHREQLALDWTLFQGFGGYEEVITDPVNAASDTCPAELIAAPHVVTVPGGCVRVDFWTRDVEFYFRVRGPLACHPYSRTYGVPNLDALAACVPHADPPPPVGTLTVTATTATPCVVVGGGDDPTRSWSAMGDAGALRLVVVGLRAACNETPHFSATVTDGVLRVESPELQRHTATGSRSFVLDVRPVPAGAHSVSFAQPLGGGLMETEPETVIVW